MNLHARSWLALIFDDVITLTFACQKPIGSFHEKELFPFMCLSLTQIFRINSWPDFSPILLSSELIMEPEAHQRYSTGYIQCMHEVHNLLLSCDWMDKTLGTRLLNHLLHSLPKSTPSKPPSTRKICEVDDSSSPPGVALPILTNDPALLTRLPPTKSPHLTALEMWRPW